jgi:DMSO/TMAO reductase YedYZ heme-binding membrane subunit
VLVFVLRKQQNKDDYFWAGRALGWKTLSLSIMARPLTMIGLIFYGPMLTMFILAIASKKRCSRHVNNRVL